MTEAERIERAAEAMRSSQPWSSFWSLDDARLLARAAITAYLGGGVVVPREPTREMWAAGGTASLGKANTHHDILVGSIYRAMISAAEMEG